MKSKNVLIILIGIAMVIVILLLIFITINKDINSNKTNSIENTNNDTSNINYEQVKSDSMYFTIKNCLNKYIKEIKEKDAKGVLEIIDDEYVKEKNLTEQNVFKNINSISENEEIKINSILISKNDKQQYFVYAELREKGDTIEGRKKVYYTVNIDLEDKTFSIIPSVQNKEVFDE